MNVLPPEILLKISNYLKNPSDRNNFRNIDSIVEETLGAFEKEKIIIPHYYDFLPEEQITLFEMDMEDGLYQKWVELYPDEEFLYSIFGAFLNFNSPEESDIIYFAENGVDFNVITNVYDKNKLTNALHFACENRNPKLIKWLIQNGADVDFKVDGLSPIETVLIGHSYDDLFDLPSAEKSVKVLIDEGAISNVKDEVVEEYGKNYFGEDGSDYLKYVLKYNPYIVKIDDDYEEEDY
jgi:ankyrin repeat protein